MKKTLKHSMAVLVALAMLLVMAIPAFAADNPTLTVNNAKDNVKYAKMFSATKSGDAVGYELNPQFNAFFIGKITGAEDPDGDSAKQAKLSQQAYDYVQALYKAAAEDTDNKDTTGTIGNTDANADAEIVQFAADAMAYAKDATKNVTVGTISVSNGTATQALDPGYYVVYNWGNATGKTTWDTTAADRGTDAMLINLTENQTVNLKGVFPTVDKTIGNKKTAAASVGDKVTYTLTSFVPDMKDYKYYTLRFKDTLSNGLTFDATSVKVEIGGQDKTTSFTVAQNGQVVTITCIDLKAVENINTYDDIVVTYDVTVNQNAVVESTGNKNSAVVDYSHNPDSDWQKSENPPTTPDPYPETSTESVTTVYTYEFDLFKYAYNDDATAEKAPLAGAQFELKDSNKNVIKVVKSGDTYKVDAAKASSAIIETPDNGKVNIEGLDAGTYYLTETKAPDGYNRITSDITITIKAKEEDGELTGEKTLTINGDQSATDATTVNQINVSNKAGSILPSTGGIGTYIVVLAGLAIVAAGVILMTRKNKKEEE